MGRQYAGILGLVAFVTVLTRNLIDGSAAPGTLKIATICLFVFAAIGYVAGQVADLIVWDSVRTRFDSDFEPQKSSPSSE